MSFDEEDEGQGRFDFTNKGSIQAAFELFDRQNPEVYELFIRFAWELKRAGHRRYSSDAIIHRIRWHYAVRQNRPEGEFKICNNFTSRYARKLMSENAEFEGFFVLRAIKRW